MIAGATGEVGTLHNNPLFLSFVKKSSLFNYIISILSWYISNESAEIAAMIFGLGPGGAATDASSVVDVVVVIEPAEPLLRLLRVPIELVRLRLDLM